MIGGADYTDMRRYNYFANPFVAFQASSPLTGFVIGDTLTFKGGISLGLGLSVHQGTRLSGAEPGDPLTMGSAPPVQPYWRDARLGFYIGVVFDTNIYNALTAKPSPPSN